MTLSEIRESRSNRLLISILEDESLLEALRSRGLNILSMCGGRGLCGKCRVMVPKGSGNLTRPTQTERALLSRADLDAGYRLACLAKSTRTTAVELVIPPESEETQQRLVVSGLTTRVTLMPAVRKFFLRIQSPTLKDPTADLERLTETLRKKENLRISDVGYRTLRVLPGILRGGDWKVTVSVFKEKKIVKVEPGDRTDVCYGFAVDIGTTKLAGYLVNLNNGETATTVSSLNPQAKYGADIISRITYTMMGEEAMAEMNRCVVEAVNSLIHEACQRAGLSTQDVIDVSVAGNTAMHHFFLGLPSGYLSLAPYPPVARRGLEVEADKLGLNIAPDAKAYLFPVVAGFVGGDAVADMIATRIHSARELSMLIDIGTNAEIVLGNREGLVACSCASGPAFEGAHIKHGMRASEGAIEKIWIDPQTLDVSYRVIGGVRPVGICGSAIVDGVAEMFRSGVVDSRGRILRERRTWRIRETDGGTEMVIVSKSDAGIDDDIVVTQSDVREIQLAKAAVYTGVSILMRHMRVKPDEVRKVYLAGAFGTYVDPASARDIGMFPEIPLSRIEFVGNTAGSGARMALISNPTRRLAERILSRVDYVELGADPRFQEEFLAATDLPNAKKELFPTVNRIIEHNLSLFQKKASGDL